jgi:photosystem II stability/assembly factor-like uncharacterized protein
MRRVWLAALTCLLLLPPRASAQGADRDDLDYLLFQALAPRCIGPAVMSGRVTDLAVVEKRPATFYVASASGGLWKTVNNGTTFTPLFDRQATVSLGAVAVSQSHPDIVWVGTGEANARNSVSWGDGVYKSSNGGKSWKCMGLGDSHSIGRIAIHPTNPDIVYVAALGHLWGPNKERGLYKTQDGGLTWQVSKFIDENTGFIDVAMDPTDPATLYAAAYQVRRDAFSGGNPATQTGPGAGLYKTSDAGTTWERLAGGLPDRPCGRCGLSIYRKNPSTVFAVVQTDRTSVTTVGQAANLKEREIVNEWGAKQTSPITPDDGGIFRSDDKGKTWRQVNSLCPRPFYYGQIRVDPSDVNRVYVLGIALHVSHDGGKSFLQGEQAPGTHADYHALWIDPRDADHLILGCDGGVNFSYDRGANWEHLKNLPIGQFYAVAVDLRKPYRIYGGLQDNGTWAGPSATRDPAGIALADWSNLMGFDGYYCQVDPTDADTVYCEGQYAILRRVNVRTGENRDIKPRLPVKGDKADLAGNIVPPPPLQSPGFRFNWCTPILLSTHNPRTVYVGGNHVFRSVNRGEVWEIISGDLTLGKPGPDSSMGHTITTLAESPLKYGLLFAGTDDGRILMTRDGGHNWTNLSANLSGIPAARCISRIECSHFAEGTAYVTIDRHRNDDRKPYLFKTTDFGATWHNLTNNLPASGSVHVVREDPRNNDLLYVGTEFGLFLSLDAGSTWHRHSGLPTVAVYDLVVHPRDRELVIATHGRGIWILNVAPLQEFTAAVRDQAAHLFTIQPATALRPRGTRIWEASRTFLGSNPPFGARLYYYLKGPQFEGPSAPRVVITDSLGKKVVELATPAKGGVRAGLHVLVWGLSSDLFSAELVPAGDYVATLHVGGKSYPQRLRIEAGTVEMSFPGE